MARDHRREQNAGNEQSDVFQSMASRLRALPRWQAQLLVIVVTVAAVLVYLFLFNLLAGSIVSQ